MFRYCRFFIQFILIFPLVLVFNAYSASLQVSPVNIDFKAGEKAKAVYASNVGNSPINAQIRIYAWQQQAGKEVLVETKDIIVTPPLTAISAGEQQLIRVILPTAPQNSTEQSYRLILDELPGNKTANSENAVRFLLRYSLPVFVNTPKTTLDINKIEVWVDTRSKPAKLWIANNNDQHIKLSDVVIINNNVKYKVSNGLLGYVLQNNRMSWALNQGITSGQTLNMVINEDTKVHTFTVNSR